MRRFSITTFFLLPFLFFFLPFHCASANTQDKNARKVLPPEEGQIYHCAHPDFGLWDDTVTQQAVARFIDLAGKGLAWCYWSDHWNQGIRFDAARCRTLSDQGIVPLVGMMPWSTRVQGVAEKKYTLARIARGDFDAPLRAYACDVRDFGRPVMIEFGPEGNGAWFPWSAAWNGGGPEGAYLFQYAYRHIVSLFRSEGAFNVTWVFHADAFGHPSSTQNPGNAIRNYYPGDDWVDWIGVSFYGRLRDGPAKDFVATMDALYVELEKISPTKPFAILEIGIREDFARTDKPRWIAQAYGTLAAGRYPRIKAVSWWNKPRRPNGERSYLEIDSSPQSLAAYREAVAPDIFVETARVSGE